MPQTANDHDYDYDDTERLAYSVDEAARASGLGRTTLYGLIRSGRLASHLIGRRRIIPVHSLRALINGHTGEADGMVD